MHTVAIANLKGGVGKTATAQGVLHAAAARNLRALGVDLDTQGNMSQQLTGQDIDTWFDPTLAEVLDQRCDTTLADVIVGTKREGIDLAPSGLDASAKAEEELMRQDFREGALMEALDQIDSYDLAVIDCPPALGVSLTNALAAADSVVLVTEPTSSSYAGVDRVVQTIDAFNAAVLKRPKYGIEPTRIAGIVINAHRTGVRSEIKMIELIRGYADAGDIPVLGEPLKRLALIGDATAAGIGFDTLSGDQARAAREHFDTVLDAVLQEG